MKKKYNLSDGDMRALLEKELQFRWVDYETQWNNVILVYGQRACENVEKWLNENCKNKWKCVEPYVAPEQALEAITQLPFLNAPKDPMFWETVRDALYTAIEVEREKSKNENNKS